MKEKYDIAIIDTGINSKHPSIKYGKYDTLHIYISNNNIVVDKNAEDEIGHGTAIYSIINRYVPDAKVLVVKVFESSMNCSTELMIDTLEYILENYSVKVVNISNGVEYCDLLGEFEDICDKLTNRNTIIVAALSNSGAISYPAAFRNVIGVDMSLFCKHISDFEYVEDEVINIRAVGVTQKLPWIEDKYQRVSGTSFACPYISAHLLRNYGTNMNVESAKQILKEGAKKIYPHVNIKERKKLFPIEKAIVFPFNKEIHSIIRFSDMINFKVQGVYDVVQIGNCGKRTSDILGHEKNNFIIQNYKKIKWDEDFDTLIIGHTQELSYILGYDVAEELLNNCKKYEKKCFIFDNLKEKWLDEYEAGLFYTPIIYKENVPTNRFGKLYKIGKPILCVTGTSSKQGKFYTQLMLRKFFLNDGFKVGELGTEPASELFDMDEVYTMGYNKSSYLDSNDEITMINYQLHEIERKDVDIILIGSQSQSISYEYGNLRYMPIHQNNLLYATNPDAYVLVCNYYDEESYILRTMKFLHHFGEDNNIVAIALFPEESDLQWTCLTGKKKMVAYDQAKKRAKELEEICQIPAFVIGKEDDKLYKKCLEYFGEE